MRQVEEVGFGRAALVAARLLETPVVLLRAGPLPVEKRLEVFDAVMGLLPYGFRAGLAVATWAQPSPEFRLSFGRYEEPGKLSIDWWDERTVLDLGDGLASRYHTMLRTLWERDGGVRLVEHLAAASTACTFQQPEVALDRLREFDPPFTAVLDIRAGQGDAASVRALLDAGAVPKGDRAAPDLVEFLLLKGDGTDLPRIDGHWDEAQLPKLLLATLALLRRDEPADDRLRFAEGHGQLDLLLAALLAPEDAGDRELATRARAAQYFQHHAGLPTPGGWPAVRAALVNHPEVVYDLLEPFAERGDFQYVVRFATWLSAHGPPLAPALRPLQALVGHERVWDADLETVDARHLPVLLALSRHLGGEGAVAAIVEAWLRAGARTFDAETPFAPPRILDDCAQTNLSRETAVQLDCLSLLSLGRPARPLDETLTSENATGYLHEFEAIYWQETLDQVRAVLAERLAGHLLERSWTQPADLAERVLLLCRCAVQAHTQPAGRQPPAALLQPLTNVVLNGVERDRSVLRRRAFTGWWAERLEQSPEHRGMVRLLRLREELAPEAPVSETAAVVAQALVSHTRVDDVFTLLADQETLRQPRQIGLFLDHLAIALELVGIETEPARELRRSVGEGMRQGTCGPAIATAFTTYVAELLPKEVIERILHLAAVADHVSEGWRPRLVTAARSLAKSARRLRRPSRGR
ncbi:MAG: hypothetical protein ACRD0K_14430 [Egibacteraceae bacterium]